MGQEGAYSLLLGSQTEDFREGTPLMGAQLPGALAPTAPMCLP